MAKKLPLIISTLTLLTSSLASTAVWANDTTHSLEGPWSFEEMMAVERELQPIIDEVCPYENFPSSCADRYTFDRYYEDPIYFRLPGFENPQFHILSLDPDPKDGKATIEYYFNPENYFEKYYRSNIIVETDSLGNVLRKYYDPTSYTHTMYNLYIYQVEGDNLTTPEDKSLYAEVFSSPYTRILYSGGKSENEYSLLPFNEKGTLKIEEFSHDPKYNNFLYMVYEDENGKMHVDKYDLRECHQGGEICKLRYYKEKAEPYLVNKPTYEEGYADGYEAGFADGQNEGYTAGFEDGYTNGENDGYDSGFAAGTETGYNAGYNDGHSDGYSEGRDNGYDDGYNEGYSNGLDQGFNEGYELGRMTGREEGWMEGYENGLNDGSANNSGDNSNSGTPDPIINNEISVISTSSINVGSGLSNSIKTKLSPRTPNTGSPTHENSSTEFPWWLGVVFALGAVVLIWLFAPSRKKTSKNLEKTIDNTL